MKYTNVKRRGCQKEKAKEREKIKKNKKRNRKET